LKKKEELVEENKDVELTATDHINKHLLSHFKEILDCFILCSICLWKLPLSIGGSFVFIIVFRVNVV